MTASARSLLFNEDADSNQNTALGLDGVIAQAEEAYDAAEEAGEAPVDLIAPEGPTTDEADEEESTDEETPPEGEEESPPEGEEQETPPEGEEEAKPSARFASQEEAERAHREAELAMQKAMWERDQANAHARAVQEYQQSHLAQLGTPASLPATDDTSLMSLAQTDPVTAFNQAIESGNDNVVEQIIASVSVDSQTFASKAAMAAEEGDTESAQAWQQRALNAATLHRQMLRADQDTRWQSREAEVQEQVAQQLAPIQNERVTNALTQAATKVMSSEFFEGVDTAPYDAAIGQYCQQYPHIMGDWSPPAMEAGFLTAAQNVVFGGQQQMVQHLVDRKVAEQAGGAKPKSKARGTAGGTGRKPAASAQPGSLQADADEVRQSVTTGGRPSGMGVLFGGG